MSWYSDLKDQICCNTRAIRILQQGGGGGTYTAGDGLDLTGTEFSVDSTVVRLTGAQTLEDKTLDGAKPVNGFLDSSNNKVLDFAQVALAVNSVLVTNSATGNAVTISAQGTDAAISINLVPIGTGTLQYDGIEIGFRGIPSIVHTAAEVTDIDSHGKSYDHPASDANDRTVTIDGAVNYPVGACISGTNMSANVQSVAITTDTLYLAGTGATGTRTVAQYGVWTARKQASGVWLISGINVT